MPADSQLPQPAKPTSKNDPHAQTIKLYPDIALALLRNRLVAPGRLWLLLRYLDPAGRGWVETREARRQLTAKEAPLRVFGWRQMRKLLVRGEGLFWHRDDSRLWLRSPLKVASALEISRLHHQPVALPMATLLRSIGLVRAHFYASFHSGRTSDEKGSTRAAPISRATLQEICQSSRRTLRQYERRAGVQKRRNYAIGRTRCVADFQNQAWERGRAVFQITDHTGRAGREDATYTAWQLPNSYQGPHEKQPKGRQKWMNRKLADLFMKGMTGNGKRVHQIHHVDDAGGRIFFNTAVAAADNYNRCPDRDIYWRGRQRRMSGETAQCQLWHWIPHQGNDFAGLTSVQEAKWIG